MAAASPKVRKLVVERDQYRCARDGVLVTGRYSLHHRKPCRMGGSRDPLTNSAANQILLHGTGTEGCHYYIERYRDESRALGWLLYGIDDPTEVPMLHALYGWVLLDTSGGYERTGRRPG